MPAFVVFSPPIRYLRENFVLLLILVNFVSSSPTAEDYFEELRISPRQNGFSVASFKFLVQHRGELGNHYQLFPKSIGEIIQKYSVNEIHFSLSDSYWRTYEWGYQPAPASPTGAQLWAWFDDGNTSVGIDTRWPDLVYALGSFFCVSLTSTAPQQRTVQPRFSYRPRGVLASKKSGGGGNNLLRYIILPEERVCTENLVPWKKLLPCKGLSGLGSLLSGNKLHYTHYRSVAIDVRRVCDNDHDQACVDESQLRWELSMTMTLVFDTAAEDREISDWSFASLFGTRVSSACSVATSSVVLVDVPGPMPELKPSNWSEISPIGGGHGRVISFDLPSYIDSIGYLNIVATYPQQSTVTGGTLGASTSAIPPPIYIHSFVAGTGLREGLLISQLINNLNVSVPILYVHAVPWFLRVYYHTLDIVCDGGRKIEPKLISYQPGRDRVRPYLLEFGIDLPPTPVGSPCRIAVQFERALLRYTEYPPDAHHGFPVPAPMISFYLPSSIDYEKYHITSFIIPDDEAGSSLLSNYKNDSSSSKRGSFLITAYGKSLLVNLPTPDFSMPYNVICLVCTVVALAFGPVHSLTTKRLLVVDVTKAKKGNIVAKIKEKLQKLTDKLLRRNKVAVQAETHSGLLQQQESADDSKKGDPPNSTGDDGDKKR